MKKIYKVLFFVVTFSLLGIYGCETLDVENLNAPDTGRVIETPDDLLGVAGGAFRVIHNRLHSYTGLMMPLTTMADEMSCSWGNAAMKDLSSEPRVGYNNTVTYGDAFVNRETWISLNSALSQVNDVLIEIEGGSVIVDAATTEMVKAWGYFIQGLVHGYLGATFQKGFVVDETTDLETLEFQPYDVMIDAAVGYLDKAITACSAQTFILPDGWIKGSNLTNVELGEFANFLAAKFIISEPRNSTEAAAIDWNKVKTYCQNGLSADINIDIIDNWSHSLMGYAQTPGWLRVDNRVINMMDPTYPSRWNADGTPPSPQVATSPDARLLSDFAWYSTVPFRPERGYYHFSYYYYYHFPDFDVNWTGILPVWPVVENDLMLAEAMVRTTDKAGAILILNSGTRVTRGALAPIAAGASEANVLDAIFYERSVELFAHSLGTAFFDMRRRDYLQPGTLLHFPVPGKELETLGLPYYSLGGSNGIEGIDYEADVDTLTGFEPTTI